MLRIIGGKRGKELNFNYKQLMYLFYETHIIKEIDFIFGELFIYFFYLRLGF